MLTVLRRLNLQIFSGTTRKASVIFRVFLLTTSTHLYARIAS